MLYDFRDLQTKGRYRVTVRKHPTKLSLLVCLIITFAINKSTKHETEWICVMSIRKRILGSQIRRRVWLMRNLKTPRFFDQMAP